MSEMVVNQEVTVLLPGPPPLPRKLNPYKEAFAGFREAYGGVSEAYAGIAQAYAPIRDGYEPILTAYRFGKRKTRDR